MSIVGDKRDILAKIGALKTLNDGLPDFKISDSLSSVTNSNDTISFLVDIIKTLVGIQDLVKEVNNFLTYNIPQVETEIKEVLKDLLKEYISCKSNPSIPDYLLNNNAGIVVPISKIDFLDIFHINPKSISGPLIYNDNNSGLSSLDLNTFLYEVIQLNGTTEEWTGANGNPVMDFAFNQIGVNSSNELTIKASDYYSNPANNKTLIDLNNDFIDSIKLFSPEKIITNIIDVLYGTISFSSNKTQEQMVGEQQIDSIIQNLLAEDEDDLDNSFFSFTTEKNVLNEALAKDRKNGIRKLADCGNLESSIDVTSLINDINEIISATTTTQLSESINTTLTNVANNAASNAASADQPNIKLNFIEELIKNLAKSIVNTIISPKMMVMFMVNHKIVFGPNASWSDAIDFLRKNKSLIKKITNKVRDIITNFLLSLAIKLITDLIAAQIAGNLKESVNSQKAVLLSLFGVPQDVLRLIQGLR